MGKMTLTLFMLISSNVLAAEVCVISEVQGVDACTVRSDCSDTADSGSKRGQNDGLCGQPKMITVKALLDKGYVPVGDATYIKR